MKKKLKKKSNLKPQVATYEEVPFLGKYPNEKPTFYKTNLFKERTHPLTTDVEVWCSPKDSTWTKQAFKNPAVSILDTGNNLHIEVNGKGFTIDALDAVELSLALFKYCETNKVGRFVRVK